MIIPFPNIIVRTVLSQHPAFWAQYQAHGGLCGPFDRDVWTACNGMVHHLLQPHNGYILSRETCAALVAWLDVIDLHITDVAAGVKKSGGTLKSQSRPRLRTPSRAFSQHLHQSQAKSPAPAGTTAPTPAPTPAGSGRKFTPTALAKHIFLKSFWDKPRTPPQPEAVQSAQHKQETIQARRRRGASLSLDIFNSFQAFTVSALGQDEAEAEAGAEAVEGPDATLAPTAAGAISETTVVNASASAPVPVPRWLPYDIPAPLAQRTSIASCTSTSASVSIPTLLQRADTPSPRAPTARGDNSQLQSRWSSDTSDPCVSSRPCSPSASTPETATPGPHTYLRNSVYRKLSADLSAAVVQIAATEQIVILQRADFFRLAQVVDQLVGKVQDLEANAAAVKRREEQRELEHCRTLLKLCGVDPASTYGMQPVPTADTFGHQTASPMVAAVSDNNNANNTHAQSPSTQGSSLRTLRSLRSVYTTGSSYVTATSTATGRMVTAPNDFAPPMNTRVSLLGPRTLPPRARPLGPTGYRPAPTGPLTRLLPAVPSSSYHGQHHYHGHSRDAPDTSIPDDSPALPHHRGRPLSAEIHQLRERNRVHHVKNESLEFVPSANSAGGPVSPSWPPITSLVAIHVFDDDELAKWFKYYWHQDAAAAGADAATQRIKVARAVGLE